MSWVSKLPFKTDDQPISARRFRPPKAWSSKSPSRKHWKWILACDVANMQIAHGLVCLEMGYIHKNIPKIPNKTTFRPKPDVCLYPNNPLKQYDILVTRGWKITLAIRSDFAFRWLAIRRDLSMSQDMRDSPRFQREKSYALQPEPLVSTTWPWLMELSTSFLGMSLR